MLTRVLLNVARMLATPLVMFLAPLALMIFLVARSSASSSAAVGAAPPATAPSTGLGAAAAGATPPAAATSVLFALWPGCESGPGLAAGLSVAAGEPGSFLAAGFFLVSPGIGCIGLTESFRFSGCRFWRRGCGRRQRSCAGLCGCVRWFGCADRERADREGGGCRDGT